MNNILDELTITNRYKDAQIRSGTIIYDGSTIGKGFITGHNTIIRENNIIGNNVRIHTSCFLEGVRLEDDVIIAPHVVFTNDPYPPCKKCSEKVGGAHVGRETVVGANVTVLPGVKIGKNCLVGAGSVVTKDIPDNTV